MSISHRTHLDNEFPVETISERNVRFVAVKLLRRRVVRTIIVIVIDKVGVGGDFMYIQGLFNATRLDASLTFHSCCGTYRKDEALRKNCQLLLFV